jgi:hypothetical protein
MPRWINIRQPDTAVNRFPGAVFKTVNWLRAPLAVPASAAGLLKRRGPHHIEEKFNQRPHVPELLSKPNKPLIYKRLKRVY